MGSIGDAFDNAVAELCFASMLTELPDRRLNGDSLTQLVNAKFEWIAVFCHLQRRHSGLDTRFLSTTTGPARRDRGRDLAGRPSDSG